MLISENIVFSRYKNEHVIYSKIINFNADKSKYIKNITFHSERITNIDYKVRANTVEVIISFEIFFVYSMYEYGTVNSYSYLINETKSTSANINNFNPRPLKCDIYDSKMKAYVRKINADYDISIEGSTVIITITGILIINIIRERCIMLKDENENRISEIIGQVAVSSENSNKDIKSYMTYMESAVEFISKYIENVEKENINLKNQIKMIEDEDVKLRKQNDEQKNSMDSLSKECSRLLQKLKDIEEKYSKEQKKAGILEVENNRNLDEIKVLKNENSELKVKNEKEPIPFKEKIKKFWK